MSLISTMATRDSIASAKTAGIVTTAVSALGVVFGDIGTSPLYTFATVLDLAGGTPSPQLVLGALSLIVWTLIVIATIKYIVVAMSIDNHGEGGILALMSMLAHQGQGWRRRAIVAIGLFGAALIYGDGAITPAISVLSALEGLEIATPALRAYVLPAAVAVLVALFAVQPLGSARIGRAFGPVMALWFVSIGVLGAWGIALHPRVLAALNPLYGLHYLASQGYRSFLVLGGVFLCVTGAEALYADMGHFGRRPIRLGWVVLVLPCLLLNYAGQSAFVLAGGPVSGNIFYRLCPPWLLMPLVILATLATIIASQSIIAGAFSMTRQAIQLGWLPRLKITQASDEGYGQIYVGAVNWLLMVVTIGLALAFRRAAHLAAAYGIAVSGTMLMTTALLYIAVREVRHWSRVAAGAVAGVFLLIDGAFFAANLVKIGDGGYVPLLLAAVVYAVMWVWHRGSRAAARETPMPVDAFLADVEARALARLPAAAIFLTTTTDGTPPMMRWHADRFGSLHARLLALRVAIERVPRIDEARRLSVAQLAPGFWRMTGRFGFIERPDVPALLVAAQAVGLGLDSAAVTYFVGAETALSRPRRHAWLFGILARAAAHPSDYFRLPRDGVVEIDHRGRPRKRS
jgi:KUP system potassium uptake protein